MLPPSVAPPAGSSSPSGLSCWSWLSPSALGVVVLLALGCNARRADFDPAEGQPGSAAEALEGPDGAEGPFAPFDFASATPDWNPQGIAWRPTDAGLAEAHASGKPVMMVIHAEWCGPCHAYARVFHDAELAALSRRFVMILVDSDREPAVNRRYATDGTYLPRTYFLNPSGEHQTAVVSDHPRFRYFFPQRDPAPSWPPCAWPCADPEQFRGLDTRACVAMVRPTMTEQKQTHAFQAEVARVLGLVINSLYSNKEVFLRELVSNASDAIDKRRFMAISEPSLLGDSPLAIRLTPDPVNKTLTFSDDGIGMSSEELVQNLGTVAHSGSTDFMDKLKAALDQKSESKDGEDVSLIGQFGVGFYSAYLVANRVDVRTRHAGSEQAYLWSSDAGETYTIEPTTRETPGTDVVLHLKDDQLGLLESYELTRLVKKYSDFVAHPILVGTLKDTDAQADDADEKADDAETAEKADEQADEAATPELEYEQANSSNALWRRRASEVSDEQYAEFYRHLTHDWEPALAHKHFHVEGTQMFSGLLFIPKRPPFDLFSPDQQHGVRLHVKRVFIMDDCEELLPKWLRFVRGVVDSEDLPLNVSRELLQDSRVVRTIRKQVVRRCLDMIEELAAGEDYTTFWSAYGAVLKEGLHFEPEQADRLSKLVRYETTGQPGLTSLADYVSRMKDGQEAIYYVVGASRATVENAPHLEALKARGYEVLLMVDGVDQWALDGLQEFDGKKLLSATDAALDLGETKPTDAEKEELDALVSRFKDALAEHVSEVRLTSRLTDSAACLVSPAGGLPPYMERLLRLQNPDMPVQKRVLELNPTHPIVTGLRDLLRADADEAREAQVSEWIELVYDQALLAEGSPVNDPAKLVHRMTALLSDAVRRATTA